MKKEINITLLGYAINSLIDNGWFISLEELGQRLKQNTMFHWMKEKQDTIDLSYYNEDSLNRINDFFDSLYDCCYTDNFLVEKNGLCLLIAYCFQAVNTPID